MKHQLKKNAALIRFLLRLQEISLRVKAKPSGGVIVLPGVKKVISDVTMRRKLAVAFLALALVLTGPVVAKAESTPLSADDITLLLIGGASPQKMITLIEQRGINFKLNPDLVKQFYKDGATDDVIDALQKASQKVNAQPASAPPSPTSPPPSATTPGPTLPKAPVTEVPSPPASSPAPSTPGTNAAGHAAPSAPSSAAPAIRSSSKSGAPAAPPSDAPLPDPSPVEIQRIIQTFAAKEKLFKEARDNYTYHQINKVETLDADGKVTGYWQQDWDILFDDSGKRIEKVTYAPVGSLKDVMITEQDIDAMRNIQPFVLTTEDLPNYEVKYLGHVKVDYITAYVFSVRPKEIKKHHQYFQGIVWVDDRDLQIVKAQGRQVPQLYHTKNGENLFPSFTTWRQQIDGKFWFPTYTLADDTLYFSSGPVHIREIIRYTDYKQFKSSVVIKAVQAIDPNNPSQTPKNSSPPSNAPPKK